MAKATDPLIEQQVRVGEWDVHVLSARTPMSDSPVMVYLAGFIVGGHSAIPLTEELAKQYPVHAPDLPGYGDSPGPGRTLTQAEQADVLSGLLDALHLDRVVLIANSFSAQIAVEFAVRNPERLSHLVLVGPSVDSHGRSPLKQLVRFIRNSRLEDAWVQGMTEDYIKSGPRRVLETAWYALRHRVEVLLPQVTTPTLVVRGANDVIVPHRWVEEVASRLPNGQLIEIPGYAHGVERVGAPALAQVISDWLEGPNP